MNYKPIIGISTGIITYLISTSFIFRMPLPTGGYHWSMYVVGITLGAIVCFITIVLLNRRKNNKGNTNMKCGSCGKEIPEGSQFCNFCGQEQSDSVSLSNCTNESAQHDNLMNHGKVAKNCSTAKRIKWLLLILVFLIGVGMTVFFCVNNHFDADEKYALRIVDKYQDMLKAPDSLILRSDIIVIESYTEQYGSTTHCFFTASGNNSYGAAITSSVCFVDGKYFCDLDEIPDTAELVELAQTDEEEAQKYIHVNLRLAQWNLYGTECAEAVEGIIDAYTVDAKKIARKLKIAAKVN